MRLAPLLTNRPGVPATATGRLAPSESSGVETYLERLERLLGNWLTLGGSGSEALQYFRLFTPRLDPLPASAAWREYSRLCGDGSPVRICETLSREVRGPAFTVDPGPYGAAGGARFEIAAKLATQALAQFPKPALAPTHLHSLPTGFSDEADLALWLGYSSGRIALHYTANPHIRAATWRALTACLPGLQARSDASRNVLSLFATQGYRTALVLESGDRGRESTEVSFRLRSVSSPLFDRAAAAAGLPALPFHFFVKRVLRQRDAWQDLKAGASFRMSDTGGGGELTFIIGARRYFRTDEELRETVLSAAPDFGWDVSLFRPASRLLPSPITRLVRSDLAISVSADGATRLRILSPTGHYAARPPLQEQDRR